MISWLLGLAILFIEIFVMDSIEVKYELEAEVVVALICIAFVLYEFIDLDLVQQLDGQLKEVEVEQKRLEEKRNNMLNFYSRTQQLADVWLHRTTPRLELMKQFAEGVEDKPERDFGNFLAQVVSREKELDASLPRMELWLHQGTMSSDKMKFFGDRMNDLTRTYSVAETLQKMPQCCKLLAVEANQIRALQAPTVSAPA